MNEGMTTMRVIEVQTELLRVEQAAKVLGVGRTKVYELIGRREMPVVRIGRCVRIPRQTLDQWIRDQVVRLERPA